MKHTSRQKKLSASAVGLTSLAVAPFLIPVPPLKGTLPPRALADRDSEFIHLMGLDIHIKRIGQGEPVFVLLHGFAASLFSWNQVMQPLSQLGMLIAYDRPGFGLSDHTLSWQGQNPYTFEAQLDLLISLLDHFGVQKAILVGNSAGGTLSMQAALTYPERISALILVDAAIYRGGGAPAWMKYLLASPQMRHLGPLIARQLLARGPDLIKLAWHNPASIPPAMLENYQKPFRVENWDRALWEITIASHPARLAERLDEVVQPVLVVTGDDDRIVPTVESIRLACNLPNASLEVIANCGHLPHEEQPQEFIQIVNCFVNRIT